MTHAAEHPVKRTCLAFASFEIWACSLADIVTLDNVFSSCVIACEINFVNSGTWKSDKLNLQLCGRSSPGVFAGVRVPSVQFSTRVRPLTGYLARLAMGLQPEAFVGNPDQQSNHHRSNITACALACCHTCDCCSRKYHERVVMSCDV